MPAIVKPLGSSQKPAVTVEQTLYTATNTPGYGAILRELLVCNTNATAGTFSVYRVPGGGTAGAANALISSYPVGGNDTFVFGANTVFGPGDQLVVVSAGVELTYTASGVEFEP